MLTRELEETLSYAVDEAVKHKHEYVTLEHLLYALLQDSAARDILYNCGAKIEEIAKSLEEYFNETLEKTPTSVQMMPELTSTFQATIQYAILQSEGSGQKSVDGGNILAALYQAEQSYAVYLLKQQGVSRLDILNYIAHGISKIDESIDFSGLAEGEDDEFAADKNAKNRSKHLPKNSSRWRKTARLIRLSGGRRKLTGQFRFSAAARKTIRSTSANPESGKLHWRKVWHSKSLKMTCRMS